MRRNGDLSDDRYLINRDGRVLSLGPYDPAHFSIVYMILVADRDRSFILPHFWYVNCQQVSFRSFRLIVVWQFLPFQGGVLTKTLLPKTFRPQQIAAERNLWTRISMAQMAVGVSELYALELYTRYKYDLAHTLIDVQWLAASEAERRECEDMKTVLKSFDIYTLTGIPFSNEYIMVFQTIKKYIERIRKKRLLAAQNWVQSDH